MKSAYWSAFVWFFAQRSHTCVRRRESNHFHESTFGTYGYCEKQQIGHTNRAVGW